MNKAGKLGKKNPRCVSPSPSKKLGAKKKNPSPRNPLKDLNRSSSSSSSSVLSSDQSSTRRGCFSFRLSNSSSRNAASSATKSATKSSSSAMRVSPLSTAKNRQEARTTTRCLSKLDLNRPSEIKQVKSQKPRSCNLVLGNTKPLFRGRGSNGVATGAQKVQSFEVKSAVDLADKRKTAPFGQSTPQKEGEKKDSSTPVSATTKTTTPPIHASISPEIAGGASLLPPPTCFAAGHLIAGIPDRRKCRPRGILKVEEGIELGIARASMQWLTSPRKGRSGSISDCGIDLVDFTSEASINLLLPSPQVGRQEEEHTPKLECSPFSNGCYSWRISPTGTDDATIISPTFGDLQDANLPDSEISTPFHRSAVWRTPTSDSSISPFSMILKKVAASSSFNTVGKEEEMHKHPCVPAIDNSQIPEESWFNGNISCIPLSIKGSEKQAGSSAILEQVKPAEDANGITQLPSFPTQNNPRCSLNMSFQFGYTATASSSIDLTQFRKSPLINKNSEAENRSLSDSATRVSWRGGLVSQIFEMHELDYCQGLSDGVEVECPIEEDLLGSKKDINHDLHGQLVDGKTAFGSVEILLDKQVDKIYDNKISDTGGGATACSESISIDAERMLSSSDSDWTIFFKNNLFRIPPKNKLRSE